MIVDLRLLNIASRHRSVKDLTAESAALDLERLRPRPDHGSLLFSSSAMRYTGIWQFDAKMCLLVLAAINMLIFHLGAFRSVAKWDQAPATPPLAARLAGGISLTLWVIVVALGRWIGFV